MPHPIIIKEKIIIAPPANTHMSCPVGEASCHHMTHTMTLQERAQTLSRLDRTIFKLITEAEETYEREVINASSADLPLNKEYVVRLSTNEFFFYTKSPLTLQEFEQLCRKIARYGENSYPGIHLLLGSFAVLTNEKQVMNVTPYILLGSPTVFHLLIKNYTSLIDVRYQVPNEQGGTTLLKPFDIQTNMGVVPCININGVTVEFKFYNIIACFTASRIPFLTAVDICLDHLNGVARTNLQQLAKINVTIIDTPLSHIVISNSTHLEENECLVPNVTHVDPIQTPKTYPTLAFKKDLNTATEPLFGSTPFKLFELAPSPLLTRNEVIKTCLEKQKELLYPKAQLLQKYVPSIINITFHTRAQLNLFDTQVGVLLFFATDRALNHFIKTLDHFQFIYDKNEQHRSVNCSYLFLKQPESDLNNFASYYAALQQNIDLENSNEPMNLPSPSL